MEIVIHSNSIDSKVVQQVSKASSDQLLSKFADFDSDNEAETPSPSSKRRRSMRGLKKKKLVIKIDTTTTNNNNISSNYHGNVDELNYNNGSLKMVERKCLLPQNYKEKSRRCSRGGLLFKHLGISRSNCIRGGKDFKTKAILSAIDKTWTKAIRGASKVFMEKHYNRHRILIDDIV